MGTDPAGTGGKQGPGREERRREGTGENGAHRELKKSEVSENPTGLQAGMQIAGRVQFGLGALGTQPRELWDQGAPGNEMLSCAPCRGELGRRRVGRREAGFPGGSGLRVGTRVRGDLRGRRWE